MGSRVEVTALPVGGSLWGSDTSTRSERNAYDAVRAMAATPTGLGAMADAVAGATRDSVDRAGHGESRCSAPPSPPRRWPAT